MKKALTLFRMHNECRRRILIGPMSEDPGESVSAVNRAFVEDLKTRHAFIPLKSVRRFGLTQQARLNGINGFYFVQQLYFWVMNLICYRPVIAHYAISSGWAMEKGLVFMKLARLLGAKTLGHLHAGDFIEFWNAIPKWRKQFALRELERLDGLIVLSGDWQNAVSHHIGLNPARLFVVNNPIGKDFEEAALQMPIERTDNIVLALGVMDQKKGVMDLVNATEMARHRVEFSLQIAGPEREPGILRKVQQLVVDHSLSQMVDIKPGVWGQEKIETFRKASILVLPSYFENFPLVILEAAAAGMAIVTTPVGAVPEFFQDGVSALFVEPGNASQIADALVKLIRSPEERRRLGLAARQAFVSRLARSQVMDSLDLVYHKMLDSRDCDRSEGMVSENLGEQSPAHCAKNMYE